MLENSSSKNSDKDKENKCAPCAKAHQHIVSRVKEASIAMELGIETGDVLLEINGNTIEDIFDYQFFTQEEYIEVLIEKPDGEQWLLEIEKGEDEDLGLQFQNGLMDNYRSCTNKCIFCFIDQMPKGMRDTLYFKDDDSRLSFLQGNYITLTNMSEHDIERMIRYRLSPINISFQATNPKVRKMMLHNRFAGEIMEKVKKFYDAGIVMNGQIVLCKGINDGKELERSISDLYGFLPLLQSVSVVPVGLSRHRDGLYPLEPFTREDALEVLEIIHRWQKRAVEEYELHFIHASDEWYLLAEEELPKEDNYDGYLQLENGVGMLTLFENEFLDGLKQMKEESRDRELVHEEEISIITGKLAYPILKKAADRLMEEVRGLVIHVHAIRNDFFGERITVSGLLTGSDIIAQGKQLPLGRRLLLPENLLRSGEDVLLDDYRVGDLKKSLQVDIDIVKSSGYELIKAILKKETGIEGEKDD